MDEEKIQSTEISVFDGNIQESSKTDDSMDTNYRKSFRQFTGLIILILLVYGGFRLVSFYMKPHRAIRQIYLIPKDAVFIIQSDSPVADWKRFSKSAPWQCLKRNPIFSDIARKAGALDSILRENRRLMSLVGKREFMISAHNVGQGVWDFLYVIDLRKISEIEALKEQTRQIYAWLDFRVTYRKYKGTDIIELTDPKTYEVLYTAFVYNHYIASYSSKLVEASIDEGNHPVIGLNPSFMQAYKLVSRKGLCRIYIQYAYLPQLIKIYTEEEYSRLPAIINSMSFAGLSFRSGDSGMELKGYNFLNDTVDPYVSALLESGNREMKAHEILSDRTAFYTNIGFENPREFIQKLETALSTNYSEAYKTYKSSYDKIESLFDISLNEDFFDWMAGEFAIVELEAGALGNEMENILAIRTKNIEMAKEKIAFIENKIKKKTPINIKTEEYKGYRIGYTQLKGFFSLFFGKIFDKFEKPYYTYIGDYVVFSNRPSSILSFIEDYEKGNTLKNSKEFKNISAQTENVSTYFVYTDICKLLPLLKPLLPSATWQNLHENRETLCSFPHSAFQVVSNKKQIHMQFVLNYSPYCPPDTSSADGVENIKELHEEDGETSGEEDMKIPEDENIDTLKYFYAEKFQGKLHREFYPGNILKSECEIRNGRRHGTYREYYKNGKIKVRGKYSKGKPKGKWKYYTRDGKLDHKIKS